MKRLNNRWILIEDLDRKSVGEYPSIRLRIEKKDVQQIITTRTSVIVQGKTKSSPDDPGGRLPTKI